MTVHLDGSKQTDVTRHLRKRIRRRPDFSVDPGNCSGFSYSFVMLLFSHLEVCQREVYMRGVNSHEHSIYGLVIMHDSS